MVVFFSLTFNANAQWTQIDGMYGGCIFSFAVTGSNIYAGAYNTIYRSADDGLSWSQTELNDVSTLDMDTMGKYIFAGTPAGVYRYDIQEAIWIKPAITFNEYVMSVLTKGNRVFAGTINHGIYYSDDFGASWTQSSLDSVHVLSLAVFDNLIFAGLSSHGSGGYGICTSADNGSTWQGAGIIDENITDMVNIDNSIFAATEYSGIWISNNQGNNWSQTMLDLENTKVSSLTVLGNLLFAGTEYDGVLISPDKGVHWSYSGLDNWWILSLAVEGNNLYAGTNSAGVFISTDEGNSWLQTPLKNQYVLALETMGTDVYAGTWMWEGGVYKLNEVQDSWKLTSFDWSSVYDFASVGDKLFVAAPYRGLYVTSDNGSNWTLSGLFSNGGAYINQPYSLAVIGDTLLAGTAYDGIYFSPDQGITWYQSFLDNGYISCLAAGGNHAFAGLSGMGVWVSRDHGISWEQTTLENPVIYSLVISDSNVYAATQNGVFKSYDYGTTWSQTALNDRSVYAISVSGKYLFAGTADYPVGSGGIYVSEDGGESWTAKNEGFGVINSVYCLTVSNNILYAGTTGNTVWKRNISDLLIVEPANSSINKFILYPNPANDFVYLKTDIPDHKILSVKIYDESGKIIIEKYPNQNNHRFSIKNLTPGLFFIEIQTKDWTEKHKLIIKR